MTKTEFQQLLHLGHGRAILYARDNDVQTSRDVILDACLHNRGVHPTCEGTRADYMLELVSLLPDRQFYCDEVLKALPGSGDDWDAAHRFRFAACMAMDGDERAKQPMYDSFEPGPKRGEVIAVTFVLMDDLKGFLFAASKLGALFLSNSSAISSGIGEWPLSCAIENCGEEETKSALLQSSTTDPAIDAFRLQIEKYGAEEKHGSAWREEFNALNYEQLRPRLSDSRARLKGWGKHASNDERERAALGLLSAQTAEDQIQHLPIFRFRPFPLDPIGLIELALSEDEKLGCAAADALSQITHPSVRETAFRLIRDRLPGREHAIEMLSRNFEAGDHELALSWFENESDPETLHRIQMDLEQLWKDNPAPTTEVHMLRSLYERAPCSFCRDFVVKRLIELDALSPAMRAECAYDDNEDVRKQVGAE